MRIEVRGTNFEVTDDLREAVASRFRRVSKQVSELATLDVELIEERNPSISERYIAEATIRLKNKTIRAVERSPDMLHSIHELAEDVRRQVKKHRDKRRARERAHRFSAKLRSNSA